MSLRTVALVTRAMTRRPDDHLPPSESDLIQAAHRFDRIGRSLATIPSRRTALRLFTGSVVAGILGWQGAGEADAHNPLPKCKKLKQKPARKRCIKKAKAHNAKHKRKLAKRKPNASCLRTWNNVSTNLNVSVLFAQTFTEPNGGKLRSARLLLSRWMEIETGNFHLTVNTVDPATGIPTNSILASSTVAVTTVGTDLSPEMVSFSFVSPVKLVRQRQYALVLSRSGPGCCHRVYYEMPGTCAGGAAFVKVLPENEFDAIDPPTSLIFGTTVTP